ncbi:MAG: DDE-type integrase/transposase/recombinase [Cyanobacteria bacterium P01_G01_bin.38]
MKKDTLLPKAAKIRQSNYLLNLIKRDHRFIKRRVKPELGFSSFNTARQTLKEYKTMNMIGKS